MAPQDTQGGTKGATLPPDPIGPKGEEGPTGAPEPGNEQAVRAVADADRDLIRRAAGPKGDGKGSDLTDEEQVDALDWFMTDEPVAVEHTLELNIGTAWEPRWTRWTIRAVSTDTLKRIRTEAENSNRRVRRGREAAAQIDADPQEMSAKIVLAGTVYPDLRQAASDKLEAAGETPHPNPDVPALMMLRHRFRNKPGLIDQLSDEIMRLSGYDDEDIREHAAGKA